VKATRFINNVNHKQRPSRAEATCFPYKRCSSTPFERRGSKKNWWFVHQLRAVLSTKFEKIHPSTKSGSLNKIRKKRREKEKEKRKKRRENKRKRKKRER